MKTKILPLAGLVLLAALQAAVAYNAHLGWTGKAAVAGPEARLAVLGRADAVWPWNAAVAAELGRAWFEGGAEALADPAKRDTYFRRSAEAFLRSLRLDPGAPAAHFHFAQTLLYMGYLGLPAPADALAEYERAARLAGHNGQIRYEVGRIMAGLWPSLEPERRELAAGLLKKALAAGDPDRLLGILETWHLQGGDPELIERVLPGEAGSLRTYARFLGERGLSHEARLTALARAEALDLAAARTELDRGRREAEAFRPAEAAARYAAALAALGRIRFYQDLAGTELFAPEDHAATERAVRRALAMSRVESARSLADEDGSIAAYLAVEDDPVSLGEFESFLKERGLLAEPPTAAAPFKDLRTLAFRTALDFRMNRYRDIVRTGDLLESSSLVIAPAGRADYARVLGLVGESCLKLDSVYQAERFLLRALEVGPGDLDHLLALERCYERVNEEDKAAAVRREIDRLVSPASIDLGGLAVDKGNEEPVAFVSDGRPRTVRLDLVPANEGGRPLVSIFLNGRVVWENIGDTGSVSLSLRPRQGKNVVAVAPVSEAVRLTALTFVE